MEALSAPVVVAALLVLCGCGSAVQVKVGASGMSDPGIAGPVRANETGKPQLSFCVTRGLLSNSSRSGGGSGMDANDYHAHLADFLKRDAPFESIRTEAGKGDRRGCDILLVPCTYIRANPDGRVEASLAVTALTPDMRTTLMTASVRGEPGVDAAGARIGRAVWNAFVPGSALYEQVVAEKRKSSGAFEETVRRYREMPVKPALPADAARYKVQAEAALSRKSLDEAAARYRDALDVAPWWPEGHFNRALVLGEAGEHGNAAAEMKKYLMLVPDAPQARTARDKIREWEELAGGSGTGAN